MKNNYFKIHKNKKAKKLKYSKPYSSFELKKMNECTEFFMNEIEKIKNENNNN